MTMIMNQLYNLGTLSCTINSFDIWCLQQDRFLSQLSCPDNDLDDERPRMRMNTLISSSRAFAIPYFNWRAGTNGSIVVGNAWLYGRNQRKFAEGPWFTSCSYTKPTTRWHKHPWGNSGEQSQQCKQYFPTQIIPDIIPGDIPNIM